MLFIFISVPAISLCTTPHTPLSPLPPHLIFSLSVSKCISLSSPPFASLSAPLLEFSPSPPARAPCSFQVATLCLSAMRPPAKIMENSGGTQRRPGALKDPREVGSIQTACRSSKFTPKWTVQFPDTAHLSADRMSWVTSTCGQCPQNASDPGR